jgi:RNA-binding protein
MNKRFAAKKSHNKQSNEKPVVIIGKKGPTDLSINEILKNLNRRKVVKVKILKSALSDTRTDDIAHTISEATGARIVEIRGHTFTLYLPKKNRKGIYNTPL